MAPRATILVVEDDPDALGTFVRLLRRTDYRCLSAQNVPQAIRAIEAEAVDLVVTDVYLPLAEGLEVARYARGCVPPIPVIVITADSDTRLRTAAYEVGAGFVLNKPFTNAELLGTIGLALA